MSWRPLVSSLVLVIHVIAVGVPCEPAWDVSAGGPDEPSPSASRTPPTSHDHAAHAHHASGDEGSAHAAAGHDHAAMHAEAPLPQLPDPDLDFTRVCPCGCSGGTAEKGAPGARLGTALLAAAWERAPALSRPPLPAHPVSSIAQPAGPLDPVPI